MPFMKSLRLFLLLFFLTLSLVACDKKPDPTKNPVTSDMILNDLPGQKITGVGEAGFKIDGPVYVELSDVVYSGREGKARFLLRGVNPGAKEGVEGEVEARYDFRGGQWKLLGVTAVSAKKMSPAYAERLSELVGFPLHFAANIGDITRVKQELEKGAEVNAPEAKKGSTAVMFAVERGFLPIVQLLVEKGGDVAIPNRFGYTALHASTSGDHLEVSKFLIAKGAKVNAPDEKGRTPLFFAAEKNLLEHARLLKEHGADLEIRDAKQWTPLYAAVDTGSLAVAKFLLEQGVSVKEAKGGGSRSPLLAASSSGNVEMVKLLLEAGADVTATLSMEHSSYRGMTALQISEKKGHKEVAELLRGAGAK